MLRVDHVSKRYGALPALRDVSFTADKGEIIALLGRNGAGKSTLMNILTGYIAATEGSAAVAGHDVQLSPMEARRQVGYLPEQPPLYPDMTVTEYLRYCAQLKGLAKKAMPGEIASVIERTGLEEYARRLCGRLSKGYRQRLGLAQALLGSPALLILDEPGSGLDPLQMVQMRDVIREAGQGSTVLLSSHILSEVTSVCSRALVLDRGRLCYDGAMETLLRPEGRLRILARRGSELPEMLRRLPGVRHVSAQVQEELYSIDVTHDPEIDLRGQAFQAAVEAGAELMELTPASAGLEEAFLRLVHEEGTV